MSERKEFLHLLKLKTGDSMVLFLTFLLTIFADLTIAVEAGLVLAVVLFVKRMGEGHLVSKVLPDPSSVKVEAHMVTESHDCPQIGIYNVEGPLFFGAAYRFESTMPELGPDLAKIILLRMGKVPFMDTTGEANLSGLVKQLQADGGRLMISGIQPQPLDLLKKTGLYDRIGAAQFLTILEKRSMKRWN